MGIQQFYNWITSRYPLTKQQFDSNQMLCVDHFYIDSNSIFYKCMMSNKGKYTNFFCKKFDDQIMISIIEQIDNLIRLVKPQKTIFIAIDGVGPKAKINTQKKERFKKQKSDKKVEEFLQSAFCSNEKFADFYTGLISPGTEFMLAVKEYINNYILHKIEGDPFWKKLTVIFSPADVPGEGEHKIFNYMKLQKKNPQFVSNENHCIYSNDADVLLLSLATHIPNIAILREIPKYDNSGILCAVTRQTSVDQHEFFFVNILREYLEEEYKLIQHKLPKPFSLDCIINDFILLSVFYGNDFIRKLYCLNLKLDHLELLIEIFKATYSETNSYFLEGSKINWNNFLILIRNISEHENKFISDTLDLFKKYLYWCQKEEKDIINIDLTSKKNSMKTKEEISDKINQNNINSNQNNIHCIPIDINWTNMGQIIFSQNSSKSYIIEQEILFLQSLIHNFHNAEYMAKEHFYFRFFGISYNNPNKSFDYAMSSYLASIQFVMDYYIKECPSWNFYKIFPFSPLLSDVVLFLESYGLSNLKKLDIKFDIGKPSDPILQLLLSLRKDRADLLPIEFMTIITNSSVSDMYPNDFEISPVDTNVDYAWEPFLPWAELERIEQEYEKIKSGLSSEREKYIQRINNVGENYLYFFDPDSNVHNQNNVFKNFKYNNFRVMVKKCDLKLLNEFILSKVTQTFINEKDASNNRKFPSLFSFPFFHVSLEEKKLPSKHQTLVLNFEINQKAQECDFKNTTTKKFYFGFPFQREDFIGAILTQQNFENLQNSSTQPIFSGFDLKNFFFNISEKYFTEKGLRFKGLSSFLIPATLVNKPLFNLINCNQDNANHLNYHLFVPEFFVTDKKLIEYQLSKSDASCKEFHQQDIIISLENGVFLQYDPHSKVPFNQYSVDQNFVSNLNFHQVLNKKNRYYNVDYKLLDKLGIEKNFPGLLWILLESFKIKLDSKRESFFLISKILDIGLHVFAIHDKFPDYLMVPEFVKIIPGDYKNINIDRFLYKFRKEKNVYELRIKLSEIIIDLLQEYIKILKQTDILNYLMQKYYRFFDADHILKSTVEIEATSIYTDPHHDANIPFFNIYMWIVLQPTRNLTLKEKNSLLLNQYCINQINLTEKKPPQKCPVSAQEISNLTKCIIKFESDALINFPILNGCPDVHRPGDRIICLNPHYPVFLPFGMQGTVIGVYGWSIDIMLDAPFFGGSSLNEKCPNFTGINVKHNDVFNLTRWRKFITFDINTTQQQWHGDFNTNKIIEEIQKILQQYNYSHYLK